MWLTVAVWKKTSRNGKQSLRTSLIGYLLASEALPCAYLHKQIIWYILQCIIQHLTVLLRLWNKFLWSCSFLNYKLSRNYGQVFTVLFTKMFSHVGNTDCQRCCLGRTYVIFLKTLFYFFHLLFVKADIICLPVWGVFPLHAKIGNCSWNKKKEFFFNLQ